MPANPGKSRRAAKQKKRRDTRRKQRGARVQRINASVDASLAQAATDADRGSAKRPAAPKRPQPKRPRLSEAQLRIIGYDPATEPNAKQWQALAELEQMQRIQRYHAEALPSAAQPPDAARHASMHLLVENQLISGEPPEMRQALTQLMTDGMTRHDAVHATGWLVMKHLKMAMDDPNSNDTSAYRTALGQLTLKGWLTMMQHG